MNWVTEAEAADQLGIKPEALAQARQSGVSPAYRGIGEDAYYSEESLRRFKLQAENDRAARLSLGGRKAEKKALRRRIGDRRRSWKYR